MRGRLASRVTVSCIRVASLNPPSGLFGEITLVGNDRSKMFFLCNGLYMKKVVQIVDILKFRSIIFVHIPISLVFNIFIRNNGAYENHHNKFV